MLPPTYARALNGLVDALTNAGVRVHVLPTGTIAYQWDGESGRTRETIAYANSEGIVWLLGTCQLLNVTIQSHRLMYLAAENRL